MTKEEAAKVKVGDMIAFKGEPVLVEKITATRFKNPVFHFRYNDVMKVVGYQDVAQAPSTRSRYELYRGIWRNKA